MPPSLPPYLLLQTSPTRRRRSLHTTASFPAGTTLVTFPAPLLALPSGPAALTTCNYCLQTSPAPSEGTGGGSSSRGKLKACTACRSAVYCGPACQRAHWRAGHRGECAMLARVRREAGKEWLPTSVRAVAQVMVGLAKKGGGGGKEKEKEDAGGQGLLLLKEAFGEGEGALEGNVDGFRAAGEEVWRDLELQATAAVVYAGLLGEGGGVVERAREVLCKIQTNAFNRLDPDAGMTGIFLDPGLAMINHSCVPNAFIGFDKRTAVLRAARPIEEGEEITISYIDNNLPRAARHEALRLYHFTCDCLRCKDDLDVYEVCQASTAIPLNSFSLQPDLSKLRNPPIDRAKVTKAEVEAIYKKWQALAKPEDDDEAEHLRLAQARWELCRPLVEAKMWAVEPLPTTILELTTSWQTSYKMVVYALPLVCFLATECDPFKMVAPFMAWRIKDMVAAIKLLAVTGEFTASGALATRCTHEGLVGTLAMADQVSMCEALLRLAVHHGSVGAAQDWEVLKEARSMLADLESLEGREQESSLLRAWARDPEDPEGAAFFESQVLRPIRTLSSFAVEILEAMLAGKSLVRR
ncbi:hypothetical protein C8A05DRAFT_43902 [Staphylotrichum tortipilum]|uniref:Suppressor of anucleate metulae protein B n=1 Tax=Staphylotrichum tortipilum TaxID=2831512 RepID=A0AAN6RUM7_9PEZI|nr:hypothetical protein C8A05DRAFT_43902 [Staphylotrichum longicolle]